MELGAALAAGQFAEALRCQNRMTMGLGEAPIGWGAKMGLGTAECAGLVLLSGAPLRHTLHSGVETMVDSGAPPPPPPPSCLRTCSLQACLLKQTRPAADSNAVTCLQIC